MQFALFLLVGSAAAFTPAGSIGRSSTRRASSPVCLESTSRRQAMLTVGAVAAAILPTVAQADDTEDAMVKIAAKNKAKLAEEKELAREKLKTQIKEEEDPSEKFKKIALVGGGGVVLSVPFYYRNIIRLFTKVSSGGADDGYATKGKKAAASGGGIDAKKVGSAASRIFLGK